MELIPDLVEEDSIGAGDEIKFTPVKAQPVGNKVDVLEDTIDAEKRVPVTILTGYLGSGKSTLLEQIAKRGDRKLAVILNEFGDSVEIEKSLTVRDKDNEQVEEWLDLGNGCLCCSVKNNGVDAIERLVAKRKDFDHIILETTGLADPAPIATMFWMDDALSSNVYIDGVITVLDSESIETWLDEKHNSLHAHDGEKEPEHAKKHLGGDLSIAHLQIALADAILLNKFDRVEGDAAKVAEIKRRVKGINSMAPIYDTTYGDIDLDKILGLHAYETQDIEKLVKADTDYHDHSMTTITFNFPKLETPGQFAKVEDFLQKILWKEDDELADDESATEIHRSKGLVFTGDGDYDYKVIQGVRKTYDILDGKKPASELDLDTSRLVLIGRNIDEVAMKKDFEATTGVDLI